jgi:hypothetical protein
VQSTLPNACADKRSREPDSLDEAVSDDISSIRRWINDAISWLDCYWDDPELRSGFWHSGW